MVNLQTLKSKNLLIIRKNLARNKEIFSKENHKEIKTKATLNTTAIPLSNSTKSRSLEKEKEIPQAKI
jgi:hypothetical protein